MHLHSFPIVSIVTFLSPLLLPPNYQLFKIPSLMPHLFCPFLVQVAAQLIPPLHPAPQVLHQPPPYLLLVRQLQPFSRPLILTTSGFLTEQIDVCGSDGARSGRRYQQPELRSRDFLVLHSPFHISKHFCIPCIVNT